MGTKINAASSSDLKRKVQAPDVEHPRVEFQHQCLQPLFPLDDLDRIRLARARRDS